MLCDFFDCAPVLGVLGYKNRIPRCIARALIPTSNVADQLNLCRQCQPFIFRFRNGALKWNRGRRLKTSLYCGVRRWQIMLTEENVLEIYRAKIALQSQLLETHHTEGSSVMKNLLRGKSSQFSGRYGVRIELFVIYGIVGHGHMRRRFCGERTQHFSIKLPMIHIRMRRMQFRYLIFQR